MNTGIDFNFNRDMNIFELTELFDNIKHCIEYVTDYMRTTRKKLFLANNSGYIVFNIGLDNIPHLLGINTSKLIATGRFSNTSSFEVLKEALDNPYKIRNLFGFLESFTYVIMIY